MFDLSHYDVIGTFLSPPNCELLPASLYRSCIYHPSKKKQVFFLNNIDQPSSESDVEDADAAPAPVPAAGPSHVPVPEAAPAPRPQGGMYRTKMYSINFRGSTMFMANRLSFN